MNDLRPTDGKFRLGMKAVVRRVLELAGGVTSFENVTRVKAPALSKYGSPDDDKHMPLDVAADLMLDTGNISILMYLATKLGYKVVPLETQPSNGALPDIRDFSLLNGAVADVMHEYAQAISDGKLTPNEKQRIFKEIDEAVQALQNLQRKIDAAPLAGGAI